MDNMQKSKQKMNLLRRKKGREFSLVMVLILLFVNLPILESNAMSTTILETVYIDAVNGKDTNSGKSKDLSVSTFSKAKELLNKNGTIIVIGNLHISNEEKWSLPSETYGSAVVIFGGADAGTSNKSTGANIQVKNSGTLELENITLVGSTDILISNSGTVKVKANTVIKNGTDIVNMTAIQTLAGGTTVQSETKKESEEELPTGSVAEEVRKEEKKSSMLVIERDDLRYGEEVTPVVSQNPGKGEVSFEYKVQGASDSTYTSEVPTIIGIYRVKAVSAETLGYQSESVTVDFEIEKAEPVEIVFPTAGKGEENSVLASVLLTNGSGAGTFTWLDGSERLQAENDGYVVIFTPNDTYNYDYTSVKGYDSESETVRQVVSVTVNPVVSETEVGIEQTTEVTTKVAEETKETELEAAAETKIKETEEAFVSEVKEAEILTAESQQTEVTVNTEKTETSAIDMQVLEGSKVWISIEATKAFNAIKSLPEEITSIDDVSSVIRVTNIYEALSAGNKTQISESAIRVLNKAQAMAGEFNHTSNGVAVTGANIPWYVQLRVLVKSKSEYAEITDLETVILPYEIKLWNLMTQSEYKLEDGREATITISITELEGYTDIKVVHYKKDGTFEYMIPSFDGGTMSFVTTSFSPFDIGGSEELVGKATNDSETETAHAKDTQAVTETEMTTAAGTSSSASSEKSSNSSSSSTNKTSTSNKIPTTGDYAPLIALTALVVISGVLIAVLVLKKKKK